MKKKIVFCFSVIWAVLSTQAQSFTVLSPNKDIRVLVKSDAEISYEVFFREKRISGANPLALSITDGKVLGQNSQLKDSKTKSVNQLVTPVYGMAKNYQDNYNELLLSYSDDFSVVFRVYNNGVAYRFITNIAGDIKVKDELVNYRFESDVKSWLLKLPFQNSYEENYLAKTLSYLDSNKMAGLPMLLENKGVKVAITEADLLDYAGLYLTYNGQNSLKGVLPKYVSKDSIGACCPNFEKIPVQRADYIAATTGKRSFPWRLMIIAEKDKDLLYNNLVYLLASDNKIGDPSWVKPGKVAWDWWSANNLTGVNFKSGFNTETYKYFIDFAARNGIEYINMDEGWSDQFDLLKLNDGSVKVNTSSSTGSKLDMNYLFNYAKEKKVGIFLWCVWHTLDRQMNEALDQFEKWGVKGLKVDFMNRDDQTVVNFYERLAKEAAKRKMLLNFHGAFKPTGLERTYPNVINREAVQGLEYDKFSEKADPENAAHIPFIRMLAGPMDYTPGGLYNANLEDFKVSKSRPMTLGTRCHQLAMFTLFYAPLEMLSDAPTAYEKEPVILNYLAKMPTFWDETIPLDGKVGDYAVIARRKGNNWYIGGLTDWTERKVELSFPFLKANISYQATVFTDGINANRIGDDYQLNKKQVKKGDNLTVSMAQGGGFSMVLTPNK